MDNFNEEKFKLTKDNINNFLDILFKAYNNLKKRNIELTKKNNDLQIEVSRYYSYDW